MSERRGLRLSSEQSEHDANAHEPREVNHAFSDQLRKRMSSSPAAGTFKNMVYFSHIEYPHIFAPMSVQARLRYNDKNTLLLPNEEFPFLLKMIRVREYWYSWRRIRELIRRLTETRTRRRRVQRYLVDIGISQYGRSPRRGLLRYTIDQR